MQRALSLMRDVPDFPQPGIVFKDITPILADAQGFKEVLDALTEALRTTDFDLVCGVESRGFIFASALADRLGKGFIPARKPGKLPYATIRESYALEYGTNTLEMHTDAVKPGQRVLVVDDVLATGGTASATGALIRTLGGIVAGYAFVVELAFLSGRVRLHHAPVTSLIEY